MQQLKIAEPFVDLHQTQIPSPGGIPFDAVKGETAG